MLRDVEPALIRQYQSHVTEHGYNLKRELCGANWNSAYGISDGRFRPRTAEEKILISKGVTDALSDPDLRGRISDGLKTYYANGGIHGMQGKHHSEESKLQMSETTKAMVTDEQRDQIRQMSLEQWQDPEQRQHLLSHIQNPSEKTRQKMSAAKKGKTSWNKGKANTWTAAHRSRTYVVTTPTGEQLTVVNLRAFAKERGLSQGTLHMTATGQRTSHKGYSCRIV